MRYIESTKSFIWNIYFDLVYLSDDYIKTHKGLKGLRNNQMEGPEL